MKTSIFASLYHCMSKNDKPQHQKFPSGPESWCFFNRELALGSKVPDHSSMKLKHQIIWSPIFFLFIIRLHMMNYLIIRKSRKTQMKAFIDWYGNTARRTHLFKKNRVELDAIYAISQFNMSFEASLDVKETMQSIFTNCKKTWSATTEAKLVSGHSRLQNFPSHEEILEK